MTSFERFENRLPAMLDELAVPRLPDYADDLFARTAAMRQRAEWTFPERWLLVSAITRRFAFAPRVPWRVGIVLALLSAAAIIGLLIAGSRPSRVPPPFGPASNGVIPYIANGNLFIGDLTTGTTRLLVDGSADMGLPQFSPDGTRLAYIQLAPDTGVQSINIFVARSDGSDVRTITPHPIVDAVWKWIGWSPDSRRIAVVNTVDGINQLDLFDASGSGSVERIAAAAGLTALAFRPPEGREILFRGTRDSSGTPAYGLYVMNADGSNVRRLAEPAVADDTLDLTSATYTPDGSRIFYNRWTSDASAGEAGCCQLFVMNADGSDQHKFIPNPGNAWDGDAKVSPDGTWVAFWHNLNDAPNHGVFVIRADGTGPLIETGPPISGTAHWVWAPDSSKILMYVNDLSNSPAYLLNPSGGAWATTPWNQDNDIDWQRQALP
jgi:Tol biopolymer transport system component